MQLKKQRLLQHCDHLEVIKRYEEMRAALMAQRRYWRHLVNQLTRSAIAG